MRLDRLCTTIHNTEVLKKMILENPDLPLVVFAGENAWDGEHSNTCCTYVRVEKGEILDCEGPNDELIYTDRDDLENDIGGQVFDEFGKLPDEEHESKVNERMSQYDEYWTDCILLHVDN